MSLQTADLCDQHEAAVRDGSIRVAAPMFRSYGGRATFHGAIATVKVFEDNSLVRSALETPGAGRVLVIDGGGSLRCALVGDQLARLAERNGWAGIVVNGCIRDAEAIAGIGVGVFALATHPLKSIKRGAGEVDVVLSFGGVRIAPGEFLYADADGVLISPTELVAA
jgi:regulator of ribonuclease activity A